MTRLTALVVGGNRGIGLAFVKALLQRGDNVFATYREQSRNEATTLLESGCRLLKLDLDSEYSINAASSEFGSQPLDLMINCAGSGNGSKTLEETTAEELLNALRVSAVGPFLVVKAFLPQMKQSVRARIINLTSGIGSISDNTSGGNLSYRTAKAALNQITMTVARELKPQNISCVALTPGWVKTKMSGFTGHMEPEEAVERMLKVIDSVDMGKTGTFLHRDGHIVPW